jgi:2-oxoglutarate ferredoxin oxidoreductase subunit beta
MGGSKMSQVVYKRADSLTKVPFTFCPGCTHGIIHHVVAACIDELGVKGDTISVSSVGCGGMNPPFWDTDSIYSMHGRAPANATGIKRMNPDKFVFTYQGDGDLASIGTAEIVHAAHRGEKISVIFVNNTTYGMTGGQMAPTTLAGQKTTTSPYGRDAEHCGNPIRMSEMLATIDGAKFIERVSVDTPANIRKAKKAIKKSFECQLKGLGFSMVEVLSTCPTNWGKSPSDSLQWLRDNMMPYYPLGNFKDYE